MHRALVLDMGDVEAQAQRVLSDARQRAESLAEDAQRRASHLTASADQTGHAAGFERGLQEGREQGRQEGRDEALHAAQAELAALSQRWQAAIEDWEQRRERMHASAREDVLKFAFALGERVARRLLAADPTIVRDQLIEALKLLNRPTALQIAVHPDDRAIVEQVMPEVAATLGRAAHVQVHDDPAIERGGCVLATAGGYVDASISTQLDRLAEALLHEGRLVEGASAREQIRAQAPHQPSAGGEP
jgi:flagellar assembly protein FliH